MRNFVKTHKTITALLMLIVIYIAGFFFVPLLGVFGFSKVRYFAQEVHAVLYEPLLVNNEKGNLLNQIWFSNISFWCKNSDQCNVKDQNLNKAHD
jgi:hypothetical protein